MTEINKFLFEHSKAVIQVQAYSGKLVLGTITGNQKSFTFVADDSKIVEKGSVFHMLMDMNKHKSPEDLEQESEQIWDEVSDWCEKLPDVTKQFIEEGYKAIQEGKFNEFFESSPYVLDNTIRNK